MIQVDLEKCTCCGICSKVCPISAIRIGENGPKTIIENCIACGHCVAVCPSGALDNDKTPIVNQIIMEESIIMDTSIATVFLRSRRSVREFQDKPITRNKIIQLLEVARFAPSSGNSQGVAYHVIDNRATLTSITAAYFDWLEVAIQKTPYAGSPYEASFSAQISNYRQNGVDVVLRDAPCLIICTVGKNSYVTGRDSSLFSLAYAELFAPTIGLGTCISGFFELFASSGYRPLFDILNIPEERMVTAGLLVGYPKYVYRRLVDRNPLKVTWQ